MNYGTIPAETLAELLLYLNEHEGFETLKSLGTVSRNAFSLALQALAAQLKEQSVQRPATVDFRDLKELSQPYREILAKLSPSEAQLLMKGFGA